MNVTTVPCGLLQANCYLVEGENEALVIDPGYLEDTIVSFATKNSKKIKYILLTHRHFDHLNGAVALRKMTVAPIVIHKDDECGLYSDDDSLTNVCRGFYGFADKNSRADIIVTDNDTLKLNEFDIKVIHTPGHTVGGVCYFINGVLFSGDTLFKGTAGRTDFPGGSLEDIIKSISRLGELFDDSTLVYPGHGESTTIGDERFSNPFFK